MLFLRWLNALLNSLFYLLIFVFIVHANCEFCLISYRIWPIYLSVNAIFHLSFSFLPIFVYFQYFHQFWPLPFKIFVSFLIKSIFLLLLFFFCISYLSWSIILQFFLSHYLSFLWSYFSINPSFFLLFPDVLHENFCSFAETNPLTIFFFSPTI